MDLDRYDEAIAAIYAAGQGGGGLGGLFEAVCRVVDAEAAGVSIYDEEDDVITHTLSWPPRGGAASLAGPIRALTDDAGARLVTGARLRQPRRFSDIVPPARLRHARWFRAQGEMTGLGPGMAADVIVAGVRLRPFAMRGADRTDFAADDLDLLGRLAVHLGRAFATRLDLLAPETAAGCGVLVYHPDRLAAPFRPRTVAGPIGARFGLTPAEARVLAVMTRGASRQDGADALGIGLNSLKSHMRRIYAKTGTRRLPELMRLLGAPPAA